MTDLAELGLTLIVGSSVPLYIRMTRLGLIYGPEPFLCPSRTAVVQCQSDRRVWLFCGTTKPQVGVHQKTVLVVVET